MGNVVRVRQYTFSDLVRVGRESGCPLQGPNRMPWSFRVQNIAVTHENDAAYCIGNINGLFCQGDLLVITDSIPVIHKGGASHIPADHLSEQPIPKPAVNCATCRYSVESTYAWELACHRNAPVIVTRFGHMGSQESKTEWPVVPASACCGEHSFK